jgi:hypothetical protein
MRYKFQLKNCSYTDCFLHDVDHSCSYDNTWISDAMELEDFRSIEECELRDQIAQYKLERMLRNNL